MAVKLSGITTIILDIEGTLCPIWFVSRVLYPFALDHAADTVTRQWDSPAFQPYKAAFPQDVQTSPDAVISRVRKLVAQDIKDPALKKLQGLIWRQGYSSGELCVPLFEDVAPALKKWRKQDLALAIFSSGSVEAQQLFFKYVDAEADLQSDHVDEQIARHVAASKSKKAVTEDLNGLFMANFDTVNAGSKVVASSYEKIVRELGKQAKECLFLSDNVKEIYAAKEAGLEAIVVDRPGNVALSEDDVQATRQITTLESIEL